MMRLLVVFVLAAFHAVAQSITPDSNAQPQLFHVHVPRAFLSSIQQHADVDVWGVAPLDERHVVVDVYTTPSIAEQLRMSQHPVRVLQSDRLEELLIEQERQDVKECHRRTDGYINQLTSNGSLSFTDNAFHDCWRTSKQVFEYLDKMVKLAPQYITKLSSIGKTIEGRSIPAFKISKNSTTGSKKSLYAQGLIHAREWQAGSAVFYVMAGFLDGLRANDPAIHAIFDTYDWYFVPILNIDGYDYSWTTDRLWRKNRRVFTVNGTEYYGVDLNRNFGPAAFFDLKQNVQRPNNTDYPGTGVLSEPESAAVYNLLKSLPHPVVGGIDVHMYAQAVLRPFSNQMTPPPSPYDRKLQTLGDAMRDVIQMDSGLEYTSDMSSTGLYMAYGTFKDAMFLEFNSAAGFTLELERKDGGFITSQLTIRPVAKRSLAAFVAYSQGMAEYMKDMTLDRPTAASHARHSQVVWVWLLVLVQFVAMVWFV